MSSLHQMTRCLLLLSIMLVPALHAADFHVDIGRIEGRGVDGSAASLSLRASDESDLSLALSLPGLRVPALGDVELALEATCEVHLVSPRRIACESAELSAGEQLVLSGRLELQETAGATSLALQPARLAGGEGELVLRWADDGTTRIDARFDGVTLAGLAALTAPVAGGHSLQTLSGELSLELSARSGMQGLEHADATARVSALGFADAESTLAAESLGFDLVLEARPSADGAHFELSLGADEGQLYVHPVFIDADATALTLSGHGLVRAHGGGYVVEGFRIVQDGVGAVDGEALVDSQGQLQRLSLTLSRTAIEPLLMSWVSPFLPGDLAEGLDGYGEIAVSGQWSRELEPRVSIDLHEIGLADLEGRFAVHGLSGAVRWMGQEVGEVRLAVDSAELFRLQFGAGQIHGRLQAGGFILAAPMELPLFGGLLRLSTLVVEGLGGSSPSVELSGELEPIQLQGLTEALGWPAFGGTLGGNVPAVRYRDGIVQMDGELVTHVFDGELRIGNLRLEQPLGVVPLLRADVEASNVSLDALTRVFAFGSIDGRIDGYVRDLVLADWKPRTFDARLATTQGDKSRQRISQRAVDNLAGLGGASGVLSATFLRLFDEFSYDRLGIGCRLRDGICEMSGVEEAPNGYYIVVGGGLPRIDVVGFNRRVDWDTLVARLIAATRSEGPVVR